MEDEISSCNSSEYDIVEDDKQLSKPDDFTMPEELYQILKEGILRYHPSSDLSMVEHAYQVAEKAHRGQIRKSGEPFIIHPLCVGIILTDLKLDKETICAGLLHDVAEDTDVTIEALERQFGSEVAFLVDGVTKLGQIPKSYDKTEEQAENLKKMFLAMAKDIRVILIKLADRLHNARTLQYRSSQKQIKVARETMEIYAPLAQRLGISKIKTELDDLSFQYLRPIDYQNIFNMLQNTKPKRDKFMNKMIGELREIIKLSGIHGIVSGHVKHIFSIYRKMIDQKKESEQFNETFAFRIIVSSIQECYQVLGVIHDQYKPVLEKFKDFIAMPKANRYQSIHTTLISKDGEIFHIQIRTIEMHLISEYGITAFWKYRESRETGFSKKNSEEKMVWLREILDWQQDLSDNKEFMNVLKSDFNLLDKQIYCFTPDGDVKNLPKGSSVIDFAYSIHTAIGNKMVGAMVNRNAVSFDYQIETGDQIEIITSQNSSGPERSWLQIVKTTQAKNKINSWFRNNVEEINIEKGKQRLRDYVCNKEIDFDIFMKNGCMSRAVHKYGFQNWDGVLAAIGHGDIKEGKVVEKLLEERQDECKTAGQVRKNIEKGIVLKNTSNPFVRFGKCCCPVPYDEIVGYRTKGRGITIHRTDCVNIIKLDAAERNNLIQAEWQEELKEDTGKEYSAEIKIIAHNRMGIIFDISEIMYESNIDIDLLKSKIEDGVIVIHMEFRIPGREQLFEIINKLKKVDGIQQIERFLA